MTSIFSKRKKTFIFDRHAPSPIWEDAFPNKKEGWLSSCKIVMNILKDIIQFWKFWLIEENPEMEYDQKSWK